MASFVGGTPVPMPLREERRFRFDPDEFAQLVTDRTRLIIINSPHNPTGSVLTHADLEVIADVARERDIVVLSDEIYARLLYTRHSTSRSRRSTACSIAPSSWTAGRRPGR